MPWFGRKSQQHQPPKSRQSPPSGPISPDLDSYFQRGPKMRRTVVTTELEEHTPEPPQVSEDALFYKWDKQRKRRGFLRDWGMIGLGVLGVGTLDRTIFAPHTEPNYPHVPAAELAAARDAATSLQTMQTAVVKPMLSGLNAISLTTASDAIAQMLLLLPDGTSANTIAAIQAAGKALKNVNDAPIAENQILPQLAQEDASPLFNLLDKLPH